MINKRKFSFLYNNSLSITFLLLAIITIVAQVFTGLHQYNYYLNERNQNLLGIVLDSKDHSNIKFNARNYLTSFGHEVN